MIFSSYDFIFIFLPLSLFCYYSAFKFLDASMSVFILILFSFIFYGAWNPYHIWIILASIITNYTFGKVLSSHKYNLMLYLGIAINLLLIFVFKYQDFTTNTVNALASTSWSLKHIVIPLGISFFTFQQIAWLMDCWQNRVTDFNPLRYALFISFFPQLIAGPIVHSSDIMPQLATLQCRMAIAKNISIGASIFIFGLSKKLLIADRLAPFSDFIFANVQSGNSIGSIDAWLGLSSYTLQLYFDFSAYSDMAIGLALLFGISLPMNFNSPYKARNIQEFWRCWHMTLSRFLRDYLYIPLGGNQHGSRRRDANLMLTMLLGGLWHGAAWTFVAWGALHGALLLLHQVYSQMQTRYFPRIHVPTGLAVAFTFLCVALAWVPFRSASFSASLDMYSHLFALKGTVIGTVTNVPIIYGVPETLIKMRLESIGVPDLFSGMIVIAAINAFALYLVIAMPNTAEIFQSDYRPPNRTKLRGEEAQTLIKWDRSIVWLVAICCLAIVCFIFMRRQAPFLYFQF